MILDVSETQPAEPISRRKPRTAKPKAAASRSAKRPAPVRKQLSRNSSTGAAHSGKDSALATPSSNSDAALVPCARGAGNNLWTSFVQYFRNLRAPQKRLRVCESVSLGDKRFLAIVRVDSESFLLGGSTGSVSMLAKLNDPGTFSAVLQQQSVGAASLQ